MDFLQIDKEEFVVYCNHIKFGKRIVQYTVFDEDDIVVLLVSNTGNWEFRDEIIAIKSKWEWHDYKILWSYQRRDSNNTEPCSIHKIWKVELDGKERVACRFADANSEIFVFDIETGIHVDKRTMDFSAKSDMDIAALAVEKNSPEIITQGLISLFESNAKYDYRDIICGLSLYYDAAKMIGLDADNFFLKFGENNKEYFQQMKDFVSCPEQYKTLKAFGYKRSTTMPFKYEYDLHF